MAIPPRPSSFWISYSEARASLTISISVISPEAIALTGVVASPPTSRPQVGQNLLVSGDWVPQLTHYIPERYGATGRGIKVRRCRGRPPDGPPWGPPRRDGASGASVRRAQ